jgi:hypothetical protein
MSNEIVKSPQQAQPLQLATIEDMSNLGKIFLDSGMFSDVKNVSQAVVRILAGKEIGIEPFSAMSNIYIIQGKTVLSANIMANRVRASGKYDYVVKQLDDKGCVLDFISLPSKSLLGTSSFTAADAMKAQTKNVDKFPRNMFFARAISNGVKWFASDVFDRPIYVPGELDEPTIDTPATITTGAPGTGTTPVVLPAENTPAPKPKANMSVASFNKAVNFITKDGKLDTLGTANKNYIVSAEQQEQLLAFTIEAALPRIKAAEDGVLELLRSYPLTDEQRAAVEDAGKAF